MVATQVTLREILGQDLNTVILTSVLAVVAALVVEVIRKSFPFARRPRIVYYKTEETFVLLGRQQVRTQTLVIQNLGRQEARGVQVIHNWPSNGLKWDIRPPRRCPP